MLTKTARAARREEGSMMVSILIIMLVLTIGGLTIAGAVINTIGVVASGRDSAQSRAAADAGLADTTARIQRGEIICDPGAPAPSPVASAAGTEPEYTVTIACAVNASTGRNELTLVSTGLGPQQTVTETTATYGPGLAGALTTMKAPYGTLMLTDPNSQASGNVLVDDGDFICSNDAKIIETVIVRKGSVHNSNKCTVNKIIAARGVTLDTGAKVTGDVYALGGTFRLSTNAEVQGNVYVNGDVDLNGGKINGTLTATGRVTGSANIVGGTLTGSFQSPPEIDPRAFRWIDVPYHGPQAGGSAAHTTCPVNAGADLLPFVNRTSPQVIDWRGCTSLLNFYGTDLALRTDITIYVRNAINLDGVVLSSADGQPHQFNVIMPDSTVDERPTGPCAADNRIDIYSARMTAEISGIAYSPCAINPGGAVWNGLIYGGDVQAFNGSKLTYRDLTLPNGKKLREPLGGIIEMRDIG